MRHNPYVGSFHPVSRLSEEAKHKSLGMHNPHLGTFRHSPAASLSTNFPVKLNLGFKGLLYDDCPSWNVCVLSQVQLTCGRNSKLPLHNLSTKFLATMPTFRFCQPVPTTGLSGVCHSLDELGLDSLPSCAICLEAFTDGCELRNLACHHCFHKKCVDMWLSGQHSDESVRTATCPTCRCDAVVTPEEAEWEELGLDLGRRRAFSNPNFAEIQSGSASIQPSPILLSGLSTTAEEDSDSAAWEGGVEVEIDGVIDGLMGGNGLTTNSFIDAADMANIHTPPPTPVHMDNNSNGNESDSGSDSDGDGDLDSSMDTIPDRAFVNVGRFLYSSFAVGGGNDNESDNTTAVEHPSVFNSQDIVELYAAIPDIQDESLLGSTYDMCGVPFSDDIK